MLKSLICLLILAVGATGKIHEEIYGCCTKFFVDDARAMSWDDANAYCKRSGAHLAVIEAGPQQESIEKLLNRIPGDAGKSVWIGLRKVDGVWRWTDSRDSSLSSSFFSYWRPNQPDGDGPSVHLYRQKGYKWNDLPSNYRWTYPLCEHRDSQNPYNGY